MPQPVRLLLAVLFAAALRAWPAVVPTPQYFETTRHSLSGASVDIAAGPVETPKMRLAAGYLRRGLAVSGKGGPVVHLWNAAAGSPPVALNLLDRRTLENPEGYVIRVPEPNVLWAVGGSDQGVLWAAMTILQAARRGPSGIEVPGMYVRDFPDFPFRAAADWLLNGEVNRWSMDRAEGIEPYRELVKRKLDLALRYKINMVVIDGFGWGLRQRFPGYAGLMADLNRYARARGIHLLYGGYGASYGIAYQTGPIYEEGAYLGEVFRNRESYPDGPTYRCMGFDRGKKGVDPSVLGSCRANEELNRLKGEELRRFVTAVEPGALYIHNEDFGNFRRTQAMWKNRCERCRKRWPNDSLAAPDGGAGGLANGYAALVRAIESVKNPASGYDAARDCEIILISPVYEPDSPAPDDWSNALELWANIGRQLPRAANVQIGFREVFPPQYGAERFSSAFNRAMRAVGLNFGLFLYFAGGADGWVTDYPLTAVPAMNAIFQGARTIYNGTGDFYREPMEIVSAQYSWNARAKGYADPARNAEALDVWRRYVFQEPDPGHLFDRACDLLYGERTGPIMARYYRESAYLPDIDIPEASRKLGTGYLPMGWNRLYAIPSHWRELALDSKTWGPEISNERYAEVLARMKIDRRELDRRLARRWQTSAELNRRGAGYVRQALAAGPLPDSAGDLRFLAASLRVCQPLLEALADYHAGRLDAALVKAKEARAAADAAFPRPVDPVGGDAAAVRRYAGLLVDAIERRRGQQR